MNMPTDYLKSARYILDKVMSKSLQQNLQIINWKESVQSIDHCCHMLKKSRATLLPVFKRTERSIASMTSIVTSLNSKDAKQMDECSDWSAVINWASWWSREEHIRMLCLPLNFSEMTSLVWISCPSTYYVERKRGENILYHWKQPWSMCTI